MSLSIAVDDHRTRHYVPLATEALVYGIGTHDAWVKVMQILATLINLYVLVNYSVTAKYPSSAECSENLYAG